ncbi:alpha/beta hydrolase [Gemmobacter fulvus]|uniref:Alpha/beta hydrolase n=1 Tax=Gemmobacter fulvus TaxID=2840474 RepID=A0A975P9C4_9RHOB|nr:alpha/beta hydrolase [Gemmobacter fulvus]MBT9244259.1 alpha/beta hydrolase [Gemmobacter fulvus]QWK91905.1 alpha/beta hydrolase [Gemmobacter fulvus]
MTNPDYQTLIDAPTWAFIRETESWYPPDAVGLTIAQQRAVYDRMCAAFHAPHPAGVAVRDLAFGSVPCRLYESGQALVTVMYFHGGGFVVGGLDSHDDVCAEICAATGFRVISADYRLAPEHKHPAAYEDCLAATRAAAAAYPGPMLLVGDSAGGALAASVCHRLRHDLPLRGQVLIYPGLGGDRDRGSYLTHAQAPMLSRDDVLYYARMRHDGPEPQNDASAAVLQDRDFSALPPTVVIAAQCDPLADDGRDYRDAIRAAGGRAEWIVEPGLVHGYLRARHTVPRAAESFARICAHLRILAE